MTRRAIVAVLLLAGVYVIALVVVGGLIGMHVAAFANGNPHSGWSITVSAFCVTAIVRGVFFLERPVDERITGTLVDDGDQPRLWALVREVADRLGTAPPARLYLLPDVNAFVLQDSRLLGLVPGERVMAIGVPLLDVLTVGELRAVVAHEYGHYTGGDTRLGALVYRGRVSIDRTIHHLGSKTLLSWPLLVWMFRVMFALYGRFYLRVSRAVARRQELAADAAAAALAGPAVYASALWNTHVSGPAFEAFLERYVEPLWEARARPRDVYAGFRAFRTHPDREQALYQMAAGLVDSRADRYDSHPSLGERLAALGSVDDPPEGEPAATLLAHGDRAYRGASTLLTKLAVGSTDGLRLVDWDGEAVDLVVAPAADHARMRLVNAIKTLTGRHGNAGDALDFVAAGRLDELACALETRVRTLDGPGRAVVAASVVAETVADAVALDLTRLHGHRWALRWAAPVAVVGPDGREWDVRAQVAEAVFDPAKIAALRAELAERGLR